MLDEPAMNPLRTLFPCLPVMAIMILIGAPVSAVPPNVVFVLVDDLGKHDLGFTGSDFHETPNLDALAARSMRFDQGYACCQVCSPSRASILLGQFTARHGITDWIGAATGRAWNRADRLLPAEYVRSLPLEQTTLAEAFQEAGYRTFFAGKWHLGDEGSFPEDHGFQINHGGHHRGSPPGGFFSPYQNPKLSDGPPGESLTLRLADETAAFIRGSADGQPFFAMLSFYAVHSPLQTTPELWKKYRDKAAARAAPSARFEIDRTLPVRIVQDNPIYAGMMETVDTAVGRVLSALQERGIADRTIVVFTSDNGGVASGDAYATSNRPLRTGKGRQWEGGLRVPFLIRVPGLTDGGGQSEVPVTGADFYPTLLELAGLPLRPSQHADGLSLVPLLRGGTLPERPLIWHYPHYGNQGGEPSGIYRDGPWKLIRYYEDGRDELYRLDSDLSETRDLAADEPERVLRMRTELLRFLESVGARFPEPDDRFTEAGALAKRQQIRDKLWPQLERQHARFLEPDFEPNPTWWGSRPMPPNAR
ncbi:MAG: sulfatase [Planctomycetaceae bacterium]|nr:MAG: sulfatase [Planctomycetaceae bacterium]